jgi:hypothetical protein
MRYHTPPSFEDAARLAANAPGVTRFLAGGTDVLVQLRAAMVLPDDLIDLKKIPGTGDITRTGEGGWRIGVAVSGAQLGAHAGLKADWPGVVEGMELVGSTQVQGRATLTGNLCNGSPAADSVPGLIAARAVVEITGPSGKRSRAADAAAVCLVVSDRLARGSGLAILAGATEGGDPVEPGLAPVAAIRRIWGGEPLQMAEIMEAYAVQAIAVVEEAGFDPAIVNPGGGGLARGHPVGASGAVLAVRLFHGLRQGKGLAAIAAAGGIGTALLLDASGA